MNHMLLERRNLKDTPVYRTQLVELRERLEGFTRLPEGWAGDDTIPPSPQTVAYVNRLLSALPDGIMLPYATASEEGEIGLTWFNGDNRFDAIAAPDGYLTWAMKIDGTFVGGKSLPLSSDTFDSFNDSLGSFYV